jgi:ABC-type sugar transport system ATPase subunit
MELIEKPNLNTLNLYASQILELIEQADGEASDQTETALKVIEDKLLGGCFAIDKRKQSIADKKAMIKELNASIKRDQQSVDFLNGAVLGVMGKMGISKIESYKKFSTRKKPGRIEVTDENQITPQFLNASITVNFNFTEGNRWETLLKLVDFLSDELKIEYTQKLTPNKTAIKAAIKNGEAVPGAELIENEFSLIIK